MATSVFDPINRSLSGTLPAVGRKGGGWRMQAATAHSSDARSRSPGPNRHCRAAMGHIKKCAVGRSSAPEVWSHIDDIISDNDAVGVESHPLLRRLWNCGDATSTQHTHTRMSQLCLKDCGFSDRIHRIADPSSSVTHVIYPDVIIDMLRSRPAKFKRTWGADKGMLLSCWTNCLISPGGKEAASIHPYLKNKTAEDLKTTISITLHDDAGPFAKGKSCNVLGWSPLCGSGTDMELKFPCFPISRAPALVQIVVQLGSSFSVCVTT